MVKLNKKEIFESTPEKDKIIEYCSSRFFRDGFYYVTVDQIASELRISKKTIYKYFASKDDLVEAVTNNLMNEVKDKIESVISTNAESLTKALMMFDVMGSVILKFSENWLKDIQIHMPDLWKKIDEFRTQRAYFVLGSIIKQGQKEGMIIDKPAELIIHLFVNSIRSVVNPDFLFYQKLNYKEAFRHTFEILFNGILTSKGKKQFDKIFSKVIK